MDRYVLVVIHDNLIGQETDQYLIVDSQASPQKVIAVCESAAVAGPIVVALNGA